VELKGAGEFKCPTSFWRDFASFLSRICVESRRASARDCSRAFDVSLSNRQWQLPRVIAVQTSFRPSTRVALVGWAVGRTPVMPRKNVPGLNLMSKMAGGICHPGQTRNLEKQIDVGCKCVQAFKNSFPVLPTMAAIAKSAHVSRTFVAKVAAKLASTGWLSDPDMAKDEINNRVGTGAFLTKEEVVFLLSLKAESPRVPTRIMLAGSTRCVAGTSPHDSSQTVGSKRDFRPTKGHFRDQASFPWMSSIQKTLHSAWNIERRSSSFLIIPSAIS
jgi:hypothetical protein